MYADSITLKVISNGFSYLFKKDEQQGYEPFLHANTIRSNEFELNGFNIKVIKQNHGNIDSYGFIFDDKLAYNLDIKYFYDKTYLKKISGIKCWFLGCLRYEDHPSHAGYDEVIGWAKQVNANKTFLSHMTAHLDYDTIFKKLSKNRVYPAYDGLKLTI